jgi:very-short-patch-repair endonuclease
LRRLDSRGHRLPTGAQVYIEACQTRPDFVYEEHHTVIYVDGPHHDFPDRHTRDRQQAEWLEDRGYTIIRFGHDADWDAVISQYPSVFGAAHETWSREY